jgi:hypothetical protein
MISAIANVCRGCRSYLGIGVYLHTIWSFPIKVRKVRCLRSLAISIVSIHVCFHTSMLDDLVSKTIVHGDCVYQSSRLLRCTASKASQTTENRPRVYWIVLLYCQIHVYPEDHRNPNRSNRRLTKPPLKIDLHINHQYGPRLRQALAERQFCVVVSLHQARHARPKAQLDTSSIS